MSTTVAFKPLLFMYSFISSFVNYFIYLFIHSFVNSSIHFLILLFIHSFIHSFIHLFIHSFIHSFIHCFQLEKNAQPQVIDLGHVMLHISASSLPPSLIDITCSHFINTVFYDGILRDTWLVRDLMYIYPGIPCAAEWPASIFFYLNYTIRPKLSCFGSYVKFSKCP